MKKKQERTKTEEANIELNQKLDGTDEEEKMDVTPFVNNNHPSLVVSDIKHRVEDEKRQEERKTE